MKILSHITASFLLLCVGIGGLALIAPGTAWGAKEIPLPHLNADDARDFCEALLRIDWPPSPAGTELKTEYLGERDLEEVELTRGQLRYRQQEEDPVPICEVPAIADLIKYSYEWIIGITGLLVFLLLIIGGFGYTMSAGNAQKISEAKDRIRNAVLGLILILMSYLLLGIINPDITDVVDPFQTIESTLDPALLPTVTGRPCTHVQVWLDGPPNPDIENPKWLKVEENEWVEAPPGRQFIYIGGVYMTVFNTYTYQDDEWKWVADDWYKPFSGPDITEFTWHAGGQRQAMTVTVDREEKRTEKTFFMNMHAECEVILYQETGESGAEGSPASCGSAIQQEGSEGRIAVTHADVDLRPYVANTDQRIKCVQLKSPGVSDRPRLSSENPEN